MTSIPAICYDTARMMQSESPLKRCLGTRIAARRKALEWTQSELAERVGVDTETISRFERGAALPSLLTLEKLGETLQTGLGELLAESSPLPDDQAAVLSAWLAKLKEADRSFVVTQIKQICDHLLKGAN